MKNFYLLFATGLFLICQNVLYAQVGINTTGAPPHTSAMLDVTSANKGLLIPRMNQAQRLLIISAAEGLIVYQTDGTKGFYYYNGSTWERLTNYSQNLWIDNGSYLYPSGTIGTNLQSANEVSYTYGFYSDMNTSTSMGYAGYFKHTNSLNSGTGIYVNESHTGSQNAGYTRGAHIISESTTQDQTGILSNHTHSGAIGFLTGIDNSVHYDVANPNELFGIHTTSQRNGSQNVNYGIFSEASQGSVVYGVYGKGLYGLTSYGVYGIAGDGVINYGVYGKASDWGGYFTHATSNRYVLLGGSLYAIQIVDGRQSAGRVLYTDASGNGYWGELPPIPAAAGPDGAVQFNVGGGFNGQSEFYWNNSIKKLGIHVSTLYNRLEINGNINITSTDSVIKFNNRPVISVKGSSNIFLGKDAGSVNTGSSNVFIGEYAGKVNSSGTSNVYIGNLAGSTLTSQSDNVMIGDGAGAFVTGPSGSRCTFIGSLAGSVNAADDNFFMGYYSGTLNTSGSFNTFIGNNTGAVNQTGSNNTFAGFEAGYFNKAGFNTHVGAKAGNQGETGVANTSLGYMAGFFNSSGTGNTCIGRQAGYHNTKSHNVYIGDSAGFMNSDNGQNVYIGTYAGAKETSGGNNVYLGYYSGYDAHGSHNVFLGNYAGKNGNTGGYNTLVGYSAGYNFTDGFENVYIGDFSGYDAYGNHNVYIGNEAGWYSYSGNYNVFIGNQAGKYETGNEKLYIDNSSTSNPLIYGDFYTNRIGINVNNPSVDLDVAGNARIRSVGSGAFSSSLNITSDGTLTTSSSDQRLKTNLEPLANCLEKITQITGYSFHWKEDPDQRKDIGFIAQEVLEIFPEVVFTNPVDGYYGINYDRFVVLLVETAKEQQKVIEDQARRIVELESQNSLVMKEINVIKRQLNLTGNLSN